MENTVIVKEIVERLKKDTFNDFNHVLDRYGSSYANGWRFGRDRAAEIITKEYLGEK